MPSEAELVREVEVHAKALAQAAGLAEAYFNQYSEEIEHTLQERLAAIQNERDRALEDIRLEYSRTVDTLHREMVEVEQSCGLWALPWDDPGWDTYQPDPEAPIPILTRMGTLQVPVGIHNAE